MKRKLAYLLSVMLIMSFISYGIITWNKTSQEQPEDKKEELVIVTSFYPMYIATLNVVDGIDGITVVNLTESQTGCVHDYQLTTKDMREIVDADIAIINGGEMEAFMEAVLADHTELKVITASEGIEFLEGTVHSHEEHEESEHEESEREESEQEESEQQESEIVNDSDSYDVENVEEQEDSKSQRELELAEDTHEHSAINGHVWMNMNNYQRQIATIAKYLGGFDLEHAEAYRENAEIYIDKVKVLQSEFDHVSELANGEEIIIFHDAFAYLAQQLGMEVVHTVDTDSESALSAGEIAKVIEEVNRHSIQYLFSEAQFSTEIAVSVAAETGAKVYVMDSLVTGKADKGAYLDGMKANLLMLQQAFGYE